MGLSSGPSIAQIRVLLGEGRLGEAERGLRSVLVKAPESVEAQILLGNVLNDLGRPAEAVPCYESAMRRSPDSADAFANLGNALQYLGRLDDAVACYRRAITLDPDLREALHNLGNALESLDRQPEAIASFSRTLELDGDFVEARWAIAMSQLRRLYSSEEDERRCRAAFASELSALAVWFDPRRTPLGHRAVGIQQPFALAYLEQDNRELLEQHGALCVRLMAAWFGAQRWALPGRRPADGRIHVGVVSEYLYDHSVWNAIVRGWFEHLDARRFALHAFYLGAHEDAETARCRRRAAAFHMGSRGLRGWVDEIRASRLDVLVYPDIGMDPMATRLASLRLAPLQLATWGHPETTGLGTIDAYLSAQDMEPPGAQSHYAERLVPLPHLGCCYARTEVHAELPQARADGPTFVCPGTFSKYGPAHDRVYARIARAVGGGHFVFFVHRGRGDLAQRLMARLDRAFAAEGLRAEDHVVFQPWLDRARFYGLMQRADVYLDTIGFSGFNTAMQAVECALPIVTQEGRFLRGRFASAILRRMDLHELVASGEEDYVRIAARLASDADYRQRMRHAIEARREALFDDVTPIRAMEDYLRSAVPAPS